MLESYLITKIKVYMKKRGWTVFKIRVSENNGLPDLLCFRSGKASLIEVKTETGRLSKIQAFCIGIIRAQGVKVLVVYGWDDFIKKYFELE